MKGIVLGIALALSPMTAACTHWTVPVEQRDEFALYVLEKSFQEWTKELARGPEPSPTVQARYKKAYEALQAARAAYVLGDLVQMTLKMREARETMQ